jgi:hypothetical protein
LGLRNSRLQKEGQKTMQEADKYIDEQYRLLQEADKLNQQGGNRQENNKRNNQPKTNKSDEIKDVVEA